MLKWIRNTYFSSEIPYYPSDLSRCVHGNLVLPYTRYGKAMTTPRIIVLEGADCVGKTTLGKKILERVPDSILLRCPCPILDKDLREEAIKNADYKLFLQLHKRIDDRIDSAIKSGKKLIVVDRWWISGIVYNAHTRKEPLSTYTQPLKWKNAAEYVFLPKSRSDNWTIQSDIECGTDAHSECVRDNVDKLYTDAFSKTPHTSLDFTWMDDWFIYERCIQNSP